MAPARGHRAGVIDCGGRKTGFGLGAGLTRAGTAVLRRAAPAGRERWERENHPGRTVELYAGPASTLGTAAAAARVRPVAGADRPGFRAHLRGLRDGDVTSGIVKLVGISAAGPVAGAPLKERVPDELLAAVVIAGTHTSSTSWTYGPAGPPARGCRPPRWAPPRPSCPATSGSA